MLYARQIMIDDNNDGGFIQSAGYVPGEKGFIIKWNGDVEFNDAVFRGELRARYITVTGNVTSGTSYILRSNNDLSIIEPFTSWISASFVAVAKAIKTLAKGSCLIRMVFPSITSPSTSNSLNRGIYRITVNDTVFRDWTSYDSDNGDRTIDIPNVSLSNNINYIKLYGRPSQGPNLLDFVFVNTIFELRCAQDPGFLSVLG